MTWNLRRHRGTCLNVNIKVEDFREVVKIAKSLQCKIKIKEKNGIRFIINKHRKRKTFFVFVLIVAVVIGISSNYVWNIELDIEEGEEFENILSDIAEAGLEIGMNKKDINSKEIINEIRTKRDDIAWMGIEQSGTNVIVKIVKATDKPEIVDEEEYCDIVSETRGIITKINVRDGTARVEEGDIVKEGDTLIEGIIEGQFTENRNVHAKGDIEAKVWYTQNVEIKYFTTELSKTGGEETKYTINFKKFSINLYKTISKFEIYDTIETENKIKLFSDFYLPITVTKKEIYEQEEKELTYTKEQAKSRGIELAEQKLKEQIEDESKIVSKNVNMYEIDGGINIYVTYEILENIGTEEKI